MPAYFAETVNQFLRLDAEYIRHLLVTAYARDKYQDLMVRQVEAWDGQITALRHAFQQVNSAIPKAALWGIALEFGIPRKMSRIDAVLLLGDAIAVLEFKGDSVEGAADQVEDYCLDLLHFHKPSHNKRIYPIVVGTSGANLPRRRLQGLRELQQVRFVHNEDLATALLEVAACSSGINQIDIGEWNRGPYQPVPSIVEAAIAMFNDMQVDDIARAESDPINLSTTIETLKELTLQSAASRKHTICFVTGVPGAGKTLAGLRLVHDNELREAVGSDSIFLTGNLPLVDVLRASLAEDQAYRRKKKMKTSVRDPKTTIDSILSYKKTHTLSEREPHEHIVVFDEAQRAWNAKRTAEKLSDPKWIGHSEADLFLAILERKKWATLIALVGGGQEIHRGEAGLGEWGDAIARRAHKWHVAVSPQALNGEFGAGARLFRTGDTGSVSVSETTALHLDVPTRQFRGRTIAYWGESLLRGDSKVCKEVVAKNRSYPIFLTRDLAEAKAWLRNSARGTERYGCIASSGAKRIRAEGLELPPARSKGVEHWFLKKRNDIRSSYQLEVAATEFQIQGLEIDWCCLCWGGDLLRNGNEWSLRSFKGTKWMRVNQEEDRANIINTYRVLLTRARMGMVIFVPQGDSQDSTREPGLLDKTAEFLHSCGISYLSKSIQAEPETSLAQTVG